MNMYRKRKKGRYREEDVKQILAVLQEDAAVEHANECVDYEHVENDERLFQRVVEGAVLKRVGKKFYRIASENVGWPCVSFACCRFISLSFCFHCVGGRKSFPDRCVLRFDRSENDKNG